jgi:hypothetical protein
VLTKEYSPGMPAESPEYQQLEATIERERAEPDTLIAELTEADFQAVLRDAGDERWG